MTRLLYISVCLRTRQDTISYSSDIYSSETGTSIDGYGKGRRVWSISGLLLVLVCRSVPQDPPPGRLKTSLSCRSFILFVDRAQPISGRVCARGTWPTNQRSPLAQTPLFSERQAINRSLYCHVTLRKYLLN